MATKFQKFDRLGRKFEDVGGPRPVGMRTVLASQDVSTGPTLLLILLCRQKSVVQTTLSFVHWCWDRGLTVVLRRKQERLVSSPSGSKGVVEYQVDFS